MSKVHFFKTPAEFRRWLERNHTRETELLVGYHKKATGKPSMTWEQSVIEALCFGWIDGVRRTLDSESYSIRFTPRKPRSIWSAVNIRLMKGLIAEGRVAEAGLAAFEKRDEKRSRVYSYERENAALDAASLKQFTANRTAWKNYEAMAPWYRRTTAHWVTTAKKPETRDKRLALLIAHSEKGEAIPQLRRTPAAKTGTPK